MLYSVDIKECESEWEHGLSFLYVVTLLFTIVVMQDQWLSFNTYFPTEQFGVEGTEESEDCKNDLPDVSSKSLCHESDYRR